MSKNVEPTVINFLKQSILFPFSYRKLTPEQKALILAFAETDTLVDGTVNGVTQTQAGLCYIYVENVFYTFFLSHLNSTTHLQKAYISAHV